MNIILFEDSDCTGLSPISLARPVYAITCATYRLIDWIAQLGGPVWGVVRPHLQTLQETDYLPGVLQISEVSGKECLLVNARVVPTLKNFQVLQQLVTTSQACVVRSGGVLAAARLSAAASQQLLTGQLMGTTFTESELLNELFEASVELDLFHYPHDVVRWNVSAFSDNLNYRLQQGSYQEMAAGVYSAGGTKLGDHVVWDTTAGPIVLETDVEIGPHVFLKGPLYLNNGAKVSEFTSLKNAVYLGHRAKVGGEVESTIVESYSNKNHHGYLGHSYLGSWVNLGAGTSNSNLKNTYGEVSIQYGDSKIQSGMQFLGCVIGDYSKTAINTAIFTGKVIGVCSTVYGFVTRNVSSFTNDARSLGDATELSLRTMTTCQERVFSRRGIEQRSCDIQLLQDMYHLTSQERDLDDRPLSF